MLSGKVDRVVPKHLADVMHRASFLGELDSEGVPQIMF
jgi:hypothetical protein